MRPERLYLSDIVEAADAIARFLTDISEDAFMKDELRQSAVLLQLIVIREAAARLSEEFKKQHPEIPWRDIVAFRNIAVHKYFAVDWKIVWETATREVPELRRQIVSLLESLDNE